MIEPTTVITIGHHRIEEFDERALTSALGARIRIDGQPFWGTFSDAFDAVMHMIEREKQR